LSEARLDLRLKRRVLGGEQSHGHLLLFHDNQLF
jgi:hypothetical protein